MSNLIYGFTIVIVNYVWIIVCKNFLISREGISKIKSAIFEKIMKLVIILGFVYFITDVMGSALVDGMLNAINGEPIFYKGEVSKIVLTHEQPVNRKIYNITLEMEGEKVLFEDIRVGTRVTDRVIEGDNIEICYNPGIEGVVSKVNGEETSVYKYHYKKLGYPTVWDTVIVGIVFLINQFIHAGLYKKECRKATSNKWENIFSGMWKYGGIGFSILLIFTLFNVINYYSMRKLIKAVYYVFMVGEFFYLLDVGGFRWVTPKEEHLISEIKEDE